MSETIQAPKSAVLHSMARYYDLLAGLITLGREREFRDRLVTLAKVAPGDAVLDVGCGTGSLAVAAKRRAGAQGTVWGVDASAEMIDRARLKASKRGLEIGFEIARAESLPFPDASFDVVMSTLMMHHLPRQVRELFAGEVLRVLRPGGRVLVVDFEKPVNKRGGLLSRMHRHGHVPLREIIGLLESDELQVIETGSVGVADLQFAFAEKARRPGVRREGETPTERSLPPLTMPSWLWAGLAVAVLAVHVIVMRSAWAVFAVGAVASIGVLGFIFAHVGFAGGVSALLARHRRKRA